MPGDSHWIWTFCSSIHLPPAPLILLRGAGGTLNIGKPAVPGVTGRQRGVLGVTESPGLASEQAGTRQRFISIILLQSDTSANMTYHCLKLLVYTLSWQHNIVPKYTRRGMDLSNNFQATECNEIPTVSASFSGTVPKNTPSFNTAPS